MKILSGEFELHFVFFYQISFVEIQFTFISRKSDSVIVFCLNWFH